MTTQSTNVLIDVPNAITIAIEPLAEALQQYGDENTTLTPVAHSIEGHPARPHESYVEIESVETPALLARAIATIIDRTSWWRRQRARAVSDADPVIAPLMFSLIHQRYGLAVSEFNSFLWCVAEERQFDPAAVERQVSAIIALLDRPEEFVELADLSLFRL